MSQTETKRSWFDKFLDCLEKACNKLPGSIILFVYLFFIVWVIATLLGLLGVSAMNPATNEVVKVLNPTSAAGVQWFLKNMVANFTGFAPLGLVLTMTLAIGMCEEGGLITTLLNDKLRNIPAAILPYVVATVGTIGNLASDTAMVVIPPLAAVLYLGVGKNPIVGMINGYAGAQAGFSANLMIAGTDSLLQGTTNVNLKAFLGDTIYASFNGGNGVDVSCNWFFMFVSTFLCGACIGWTCTYIVEKRFGPYVPGEGVEIDLTRKETTPEQKKGMKAALIALVVYLAVVFVLFYTGPIAKQNSDGTFSRVIVGSVLLSNLIPVLFIMFVVIGLAYAFTAGTFHNSDDVAKAMTNQMRNMASYVAFCFTAGQFTGLFNWSKVGTVLAISGANLLNKLGFTGFGLLLCIILMTGIINIFVPSGSSKWTILAPVFIPMLMMVNTKTGLGYHPGFIQLIYRLGDSPSNAFTPLSPYIWVTLGVAQAKYDKNLKIGSLAAGLFPTAVVLQIGWIIMLAIWMLIGLPVGPNTPIYLQPGMIPGFC